MNHDWKLPARFTLPDSGAEEALNDSVYRWRALSAWIRRSADT